MDIQRLVKMANDIAAFFESDSDKAQGARNVANHLRRFWEPRMRREIFVYLDQNNGIGLKELVLTALRNHRNEIDPTRYSPSS
jgi:formate dehydrogenase subunit delta